MSLYIDGWPIPVVRERRGHERHLTRLASDLLESTAITQLREEYLLLSRECCAGAVCQQRCLLGSLKSWNVRSFFCTAETPSRQNPITGELCMVHEDDPVPESPVTCPSRQSPGHRKLRARRRVNREGRETVRNNHTSGREQHPGSYFIRPDKSEEHMRRRVRPPQLVNSPILSMIHPMR